MFRLILFSTLVLGPPNGLAVLERMYARYAGQWFSNLTFERATTVRTPDGQQDRNDLSRARPRFDRAWYARGILAHWASTADAAL